MGGRERLSFFAHALWVFIALRLADAVNIASGLWFVPKYVSADDIGAVLPLSSFATFLSLPLFAFAMTAMKEAVHLSALGEKARLKSLLLGVFVAAGITIALGLGIVGVIMPIFMKSIGVCSNSVGFMVVGTAFLGCVAPVYTDALQATKRFKALGVIEVVSSVAKFSIMLILMPHLVIITAFTSVQVFVTNAEVSAGRFNFFKWFIPIHAVYVIVFIVFKYLGNIKNLNDILIWLWVIAIARAVFSLAIIIFSKFKWSETSDRPDADLI